MKKSIHRPGLVFRALDLHMHTPASRCFSDKSVLPEAIVDASLAAGMEAIAITDHNSGAWIDRVRAAAKGKALTVFPGVEITCMSGKEGIHIIAILDPSAGTEHINGLLGALGLQPDQHGDEETIVQKDAVNVAKVVHERGGIAVLAHANSTRGALSDARGQQRIEIVRCPFILGAEATDFQNAPLQAKHCRVVDLLDGRGDYQRKMAVYQASDNPTDVGDGKHTLDGIGRRFSYFKMDHINLDSLQQCLLDPEVRIRQDFEFTAHSYPRIVSVKITGGFLDGEEAVFHAGLNSIIGAKGTGKSLLVEFLRFALDQPARNEEIQKDYSAKLESRLDNYGTVEVRLLDDTGREFAVTRTYDPSENTPYKEGDAYNISQLFQVLFLSQNEIIKVAENEDEQIAFIDRFFDFHSFQQQILEVESNLSELDRDLAEAFHAYPEVRAAQQQIATIEKEIQHLDTSLKNPSFDKFNTDEAKDIAIRGQTVLIKGLSNIVNNALQGTGESQLPQTPPVYKEDPLFKRIFDLNTKAKADVIQHLQDAAVSLTRAEDSFKVEYSKWSPRFQASKKEYEDAIKKGGGTYKDLAQKRAKKVKELEAANLKLATAKQKSDKIKDLNAIRNTFLDELRKGYESYSKERQARCARIQTESQGRLQIAIHEASNRDEFKSRLMALKRGSYLKDSEVEKVSKAATPSDLVKAVIRYGVFGKTDDLQLLAKKVDIDVDRMRALAEFLANTFPHEELLALEYQATPQDRPEIKYNVGDDTFEPLNRLSVGQKCTAMLIIALSDGTSPIVIDQPEDSLDIRSIWEDMCMKIRGGKDKRQFIFTTHNSSLAVASDTDKFVVMEATATHGSVLYSGSMDHAPISEEVLKYLEGGDDTYRRKSSKYRLSK
ncbi:MAG: AAA family ATPase [Chloroflexota bacterium]|nr:AAA family ATPase [Chloroflexota bacterium]